MTTTTDDGLTIPDTAAGLEELLADEKSMAKLFTTDKGRFPEFVQKYAKAVLDRDTTIATQVREETQRTIAAWLKTNEEEGGVGPRVPLPTLNSHVPGMTKQKSSVYNPKAMGAPLDKDWDDIGDFLKAIWHKNSSLDAKTTAKIRQSQNAFTSGVPADGGFLIPEVLRSELLKVTLEKAIVRSRARVIPMDTLRVPFPSIDSTSNVSSVYGGIVGYWTQEGAALTASQAKFSRVVLDAKKLTGYCEVPNELLSDSLPSFQAFIDEVFPEALAFYEDVAFLTGTGVGEPLGVLNANNEAIVVQTKQSLQAIDTIVWENLVKMYARMLPSSLDRAVWIASPGTFPELATMALSVGTGGGPVWLNNGVVGPPMTILGRPVIFTEKAPLIGDQGDISFIDFGMYLIGDRQAMSASSSSEFKFGNDMTAYRIIQRLDGLPWLQSAITPKNNGDTLSPFVQLQAR